MRIAFDTTGLEVDQSGAARSIAALRDALRADPRVELVELGQPRKRTRGGIARGLARELVRCPVQVPVAVQRSGAVLLQWPGPLGPPRRVATPMVVTLNDVMPLEHPEWFTKVNTWHTRVVVRRLAKLASVVLVPSEFTRREVAAAWDIDPGRIHVTPYGVDGRFTPGPPDEALLAGLGVSSPFILTVGRLQPRKNIEAAMDAFGRLVAEGAPHQLVVAGARGWPDDALLQRRPTAGGPGRTPA